MEMVKSRVDFTRSTSGFVARELFPRGSRGKKWKKERKTEFFFARYRLLAVPANYDG